MGTRARETGPSGPRRIRQLSEDVAQKIAAGEVIERPASVVKELIENSLDAGATHITVTCARGGKDLIRVQDNGEGIVPEDLPLAVSRFATSKVSTAEDLWRLTTLGFRGEALASMARVSHLTITSKARTCEGATLTIRAGEVGQLRPAACPQGTVVEVRELFFSLPARRKFLRRDATEFAHVSEWVVRAALGNPTVGFRLEHDGSVVWNVRQESSLAERISVFFGPEVAENLIPVEWPGTVSVCGVVGSPEVWRSDRRYLYTYVNGRFVRDRILGQAVVEAFRGYMIPGRFPFAVLQLQVSPEVLDANVHPAKAEVRFHNGQAIFQALFRAVRKALGPLGPKALPSREEKQSVSPHEVAAALMGESAAAERTTESRADAPRGEQAAFQAPAPENRSAVSRREEGSTETVPTEVLQVGGRYLVFETPRGLEIVDQHALHEKILYRQVLSRLTAGSIPVQGLLVPLSIRLQPEEMGSVEENRQVLLRMGFSLEVLTPGTVALTGVPAVGQGADPEGLFRSVLSAVTAHPREEAFREAASRIACHLAVKSGTVLSHGQRQALLAQAEQSADSDRCPHGRPARLLVSFRQLQQHFDRR